MERGSKAKTIKAERELYFFEGVKELHGVDMEKTQRSKTLRDIPAPDIVILMGCGIACPAMKAAYEENWGLDDPSGKSREEYEKTIRIIEQRILDLKEKIQKEWK